MARIRSIKPEFWTDEKTGALSEFAKCLFLGLLGQSDDYGVIEWRPVEWRAKIFPYHSDTTTGAVQTALTDELLPAGLLILFARQDDEGQTKRYAFIRNFAKHQVINKPSAPLLPGWKKLDTPKTYAARLGDEFDELGESEAPRIGSTPTPLPEGYRFERKGEEGKRKKEPFGASEDAPPIPASPAGSLPTLTVVDGGRPKGEDAAVYAYGRTILGPGAGGLITKVKKLCRADLAKTAELLRQAATKDSPLEWINAVLRGDETAAPSHDEIYPPDIYGNLQ